MVVTYYGEELHLTMLEYDALKRAAVDDPGEVDRMALEFLRRENQATALTR